MTPTFRIVGDQLQEQPRMKEPEASDFIDFVIHCDSSVNWYFKGEDYQKALADYEAHVASLRVYTIRPSDWEGITEVNEGEFEVKMQVLDQHDGYADARLLAVPLRPAGKGQEEMITLSRKQLEDALREVWNDCYNTNGDLGAMDDHIKEAIDTITLNKQ